MTETLDSIASMRAEVARFGGLREAALQAGDLPRARQMQDQAMHYVRKVLRLEQSPFSQIEEGQSDV